MRLYWSTRRRKAAWIRSRNPDWTGEQVQQAVREVLVEPDLFLVFVEPLNRAGNQGGQMRTSSACRAGAWLSSRPFGPRAKRRKTSSIRTYTNGCSV